MWDEDIIGSIQVTLPRARISLTARGGRGGKPWTVSLLKASKSTHTHERTRTARVQTHTHTHKCTHACRHTHTHIHTHARTYTPVCVHILAAVCNQSNCKKYLQKHTRNLELAYISVVNDQDTRKILSIANLHYGCVWPPHATGLCNK